MQEQKELEAEIYEQFHQLNKYWKISDEANAAIWFQKEKLAQTLTKSPKHFWPKGYSVGWRNGRDKSSDEIEALESKITELIEQNKSENAMRIYELTEATWKAEQEIMSLIETSEIAELRAELSSAYDNLPIRAKPFLIVRKHAHSTYQDKLASGELSG